MDETEFEIENLDDQDLHNEIPQRIKVKAKLLGLEFELIFNQIQGVINSPMRNIIYIKSANDNDIKQATTSNLVNNLNLKSI
jgi:hypothetical protein